MSPSSEFVRLSPAPRPRPDIDLPWKRAADSPSKQLLLELGLRSDKLNRSFNARLDSAAKQQEDAHKLALAAAAIEHERVRKEAETAQHRLQTQIELERQRRQQEEERALAQERQLLDRERQDQIERDIAGKKREIEEAQRLQKLKEAAQEAERRAIEARAAAAARPPPQPEQPAVVLAKTASHQLPVPISAPDQGNGSTSPQPPQRSSPNGVITASANSGQQSSNFAGPSQAQIPDSAKARHYKYLEVHAQLKKLRQTVDNLQNTQLKKCAGEFRREIKKSVGQLTVDMSANQTPYNKVRSVLNEAARLQQPKIDIRLYIAQDLSANIDSSQSSIGLVQTYLLNIFAKAVIAQFVNEAGVAPKAAEPIGTIAVRIFAANEFRWQGISLMDILIAKFHAICPVLFGMYRKSPATRKQRQGEALTGLGSGFAALSLRDFGKSTISNPFPPVNYWQAIAFIVNTPPNELSQEHFIVLKGMTEYHAGKFIQFFGLPAVVALRKAIVELPQQVPKSAATSALSTLQVTLRRDMHLTL